MAEKNFTFLLQNCGWNGIIFPEEGPSQGRNPDAEGKKPECSGPWQSAVKADTTERMRLWQE